MQRFHLISALTSLAAGWIIFLLGSDYPVLRYSAGDFVIVIFLYSMLRLTAPGIKPTTAALAVLSFSVAIEILQLGGFPQLFDTRKVWVQILLGSRFQWGDIALYLLGIGTIYSAELLVSD